MRAHQSTKAMANNINEYGLREILQRQDTALRELHGSIKKLSAGVQPSATPIYIGAPPGSGGGGTEPPPDTGVRNVATFKVSWTPMGVRPTSPFNFTLNVPNTNVLPIGTYQVIASIQGRGASALTATLTVSWNNDGIDYSKDVFTGVSVSSGQSASGNIVISSGGTKALTGTLAYSGAANSGISLFIDIIALR